MLEGMPWIMPFWCSNSSRRRKLAGGKLLSWLLVWESSWVIFACEFTARVATVASERGLPMLLFR